MGAIALEKMILEGFFDLLQDMRKAAIALSNPPHCEAKLMASWIESIPLDASCGMLFASAFGATSSFKTISWMIGPFLFERRAFGC